MADTCVLCTSSESVVSIETGERIGRYVVSKRSFQPGEVIFRNVASSYVLSSEYWGQKCMRCFALGSNLLQCSKCKVASYCSKSCQVGDWKLHKGECAHMQSILTKKLPESAVNEIILLLRAISIKSKQSLQCVTTSKFVVCGKQHCEGVYYNPLATIDSADLILASIIGQHCQESNPYLLRRLQQFHCNNFGIVDDLINCVGSGEFPAAALLNHSCIPNCILRYDVSEVNGPVVEIVAITVIKPGDELSHSYTDCSSPTQQRLQRLRAVYKFNCQCNLCSYSMSSTAQNNSVLNSSYLGSMILEPIKLRDALESLRNQNSENIFFVDHLLEETRNMAIPDSVLQEQKDVERRALQVETQSEIASSFDSMKAMEQLLEEYYGPFNQDLYHFRCKMLSTVLLTGNIDDSIAICAKIVSFLVVSMANIPNHPLLAVQLFTLADLLSSANDATATSIYNWCENVLRVTHGPESRLVLHLQGCR